MPNPDQTPPVTPDPVAGSSGGAGPGRRPGRMAVSGGVLALAVALGVTATSLGRGGDPAPGSDLVGGGTPALDRTTPIAFRSFDDCGTLLGYFRSNAGRLVTANGLPGSGGPVVVMSERAMAPGAAVGGAPVPAAAPASGAVDTATGSGTNVQVAGVDEADLVKKSGDLLLTVADGRLRVARLQAGKVRLLGSLVTQGKDGWIPNQLVVDGDTVLLTGQSGGGFRPLDAQLRTRATVPGLLPYQPQPITTRIAQVDLSDPAKPVLVRTLDVDGSATGVRLVDGIARIAITSDPQGPPMQFPQYGADPSATQTQQERAYAAAEKKALALNRTAVTKSTADAWLPHYTVTEYRPDGGTADTSTGRLLECTAISAPESFSGLATVSLLNLDLRSPTGISSWAGAGVVASGSTLYATADHAYLATSPWTDWGSMSADAVRQARTRQRTQIHLFDTTDATAPRYVGSGEVPGFLLGQFSMDEYDGRLRVASTDQPPFAVPAGGPAVDVPAAPDAATTSPAAEVATSTSTGDARPERSHSMVSVLQPEKDRLARVGVVDGLGRGEQIRAVRFIGPVGYVVTFRQTDPLYTVDLSSPTRPRVAGELKLLGYSAYLHPVGDGLLLGLGQAADARGTTSGLQMSLFDVRDPADPTLVSTRTVPGAWSDVEGDHHAFTFTDGLALAPYSGWSDVTQNGSGSAEQPGSTGGSSGSDDGGGSGAVAPAPLQVFDAGVLAVPVQGDRLGAGARLRPLADRPITVGGGQPTPGQDDAMAAVPMRTVVADGFIYTVTATGIAVHAESTLTRVGFTRF
jgi:hypothetical protein